MKIKDILKSEECESIFNEIQEFVKTSLFKYNEAIDNEGFYCTEKDVFDFVWGTVNFSAAEICILDSPLLQRLRCIRQLGLASMVYCNADTSRFSHTIGVVEVASRMAQVINKKLNSEFIRGIFNSTELIRLAAIFHDVGHMFFSHVSEQFFSHNTTFPKYEQITKAKTFFCEKTSSEAALHEILSVMIVNSDDTLCLLKKVAQNTNMQSKLKKDEDYEQLIEYISCLIIGVPIDKYILPYSSIINSAIDADKLDYLSRDSACTKVPIAVDIARIVQKLDVCNIKEIEHPAIWNDSSAETVPLKIMAIKSSAKKVFWQLANARSSMYESVYYHHKVLTAETMFRTCLQNIYKDADSSTLSFTKIMSLTDDVFNDYWDKILLKPEKQNSEEATTAKSMLKCIRERNLYKRIASFSRDNLLGTRAGKGKFFRDIIENPESEDFAKFKSRMVEEYTNINKILLPKKGTPKAPNFIFIIAKYEALESVPFESGDGFCVWSSSLMKQETIEAGKKSKQEQFYLLSDCKDRDVAFLALEKVLCQFYNCQISKDASLCLKVNYDQLREKRLRLLEKGYYKDVLFILQDDIFTQLYDRRSFFAVVKKYQSYSGVNDCTVTEESLKSFLRQFLFLKLDKPQMEALINGILKLLEEAYYIDRSLFAIQAKELLGKLSNTHFEQKHIITLGGAFDSAEHLLYFLNDVPERKNFTYQYDLSNALKSCTSKDVLCFLDDGAYSGKQVISIFQEYMGIPKEKRTTFEEHVTELPDELKDKLKEVNVILSYMCFNSGSEQYIIKELEKLGLKHVEVKFIKDLSIKSFDIKNNAFVNKEQMTLVEKSLKTIGQELLQSTKKISEDYKPGWSQERIVNSSLGYNDAQQMVIFSNNIPTYTITAFWANGHFKKHEWKGLFQRTIKD